MIEWQNVESSNIDRVGYDSLTNVLSVEFKSGGVYTYANILPETYRDLLAAPSKGKFFEAEIKGRPFTKIK